MKPASAAPSGRPTRRLLFAAALAVAGQVGIFGASLTLAREESSASAHVERNGVALHHGHNETTCAACATLTLQATANSVAPISIGMISPVLLSSAAAQLLTDPQLLPNSCRAPPREA